MIAAFRDAFIAAFEYHRRDFVWTNDGVLRTTVMQSYIYPFVAKRLGYYLVCELPGDAPFFGADAVEKCLETGGGCPKEGPTIVLEHENNPGRSQKEMTDLARWNAQLSAQLNVLITYASGSEAQQLRWLSERFEPLLKALGLEAREHLCILPPPHHGAPDRPFSEWWRYFAWNKHALHFEMAPARQP
jgi:hypothetical protein